jgi:hypothetical protein
MLSLILMSPLLGFLSGCFFGFRLSFGVCLVTTSSVFCAFVSSLTLFYNIVISKIVYKVNLGK